jgi:uncharacterized membrane protein YukC
MTFFYWGLGIAALFLLVLIGIGFYEFIVENREDRITSDRSTQYLYLKHLDKINSGK